MPLYEYSCIVCDTSTDVRHGFDEKNTEACPKCGGELKRKFTASGIVFKGSGFYVNDSRTPSSASTSSETNPSSSVSTEPTQNPGAASPATPSPATPVAPAPAAASASSTPPANTSSAA